MSDAAALNPPAATPVARAEPHFELKRLFAFVFMVFGMFMAILDIQIVSASLQQIQAGLSASSDEVTWVQTAYLIAEVIMIPLSGFLSRAFSTRIVFAVSAAGFTLMSYFCSRATTIDEMILWRAAQGFIGGGMIPTVFATAYTIFPRSKLPIVAPVIGLVATLAPTIGPTVGGLLTDYFSWHWLFLVNIPPGIMVTVAAWLLIDFDHPNLKLLDNFDWAELVSMAAFLGALEYILEEGPSKDWFESEAITYATIVSAAGAIAFFWRVTRARNPIVDLTAFHDRNFWSGCALSFILGIGLYGLTYIYPVYLAVVRGYSPLMIGNTMFVTGVCQFIMAPVSGKLMTKIDPRWMIAVGFVGFGAGTWMSSSVTADWDFWELFVPQILRGFSLMLCMVPINNLALGTMSPDRVKNASGLFNLTRNLGGAFGLALINTLLDKRMDLHLERLRKSVVWGRVAADEPLAALTQALASRGSDAALAATRVIAMKVRLQAEVMALGDVFLALTLIYIGFSVLPRVMHRPAYLGGRPGFGD